MASDTATTTHEPKRKRRLGFSRLSRQILLANLAGMLVLVIGVLVLDEMRQGLIDARIANLRAQGELIAGVLEETATVGAPLPQMDHESARLVMNGLFLSDAAARVQLFDSTGALVTDSNILRDQVRVDPLAPEQTEESFRARVSNWINMFMDGLAKNNPFGRNRGLAHRSLSEEITTALLGQPVAGERIDENGERVVSVSVPVQHVVAVLGVITVETSDVDEIIAAERQALIPFIVVSMAVTLVSALMLTFLIARPIRALAIAADHIRRGGVRRTRIPDFSSRRDEIGDLSQSLQAMTSTLYDRLDAIESFAADVAHEIKNPLTSIHSAVEMLPAAKTQKARSRLLEVLKSDVARLDRLITDISTSSRLDSDLARARAEPIDIQLLLKDLVDIYQGRSREKSVKIVFEKSLQPPRILYGAEEPLVRVIQNLIDNALTFSPKNGLITVRLGQVEKERIQHAVIQVEDQGPGIAEENLESIFRRFYTDRPKGAKFGAHSGLGLAIARQIVRAHKGEITARNCKQQSGKKSGALFEVTLPLDLGQ